MLFDVQVVKTYNIFFAETNSKRDYFSPRQICAIESAALNNPLAKINVYAESAKLHQKWLDKYQNIKVIKLDYDDLFKETYFENWFKINKQLIYNSEYTHVQLSDMVRLVVLLKYGGYYSDLDTITIKNIEPLLKFNGAGLQSDKPMYINNANLIFSKNHSFLNKWIPLSVESFNPKEWGSNGQASFRRITEKICNVKLEKLPIVDSTNKKTLKNQCDFNIHPTKIFSPYNWKSWGTLFKKNSNIKISRFLDAYSIHFFSSQSFKAKINFHGYSIYEFFAKNNCPIFYQEYVVNLSQKGRK